MEQVKYNLAGLTKRTLGLTALVSALFISQTATAKKSLSEAMSVPGMKNLMLTIAVLNKSMNDAAENPMDQWRRQNVSRAMAMMPVAIAGLAKEFQNRKLGNSDLPMVQAVLGGFIDKNVGEKYAAFAKNPSKNLIPSVGQSFPKQMLNSAQAPAGGASLTFDDSLSKANEMPPNTVGGAVGEQIANLDSIASESLPHETTSVQKGATLTFDDSAKSAGVVENEKTTQDFSSSRVDGAPLLEGAPVGELSKDFSKELGRDLSSVESALTTNALAASAKKEKEEDEAFFKDNSKKKTKKMTARDRAKKVSEHRKELEAKYFSFVPLLKMSLSLYPYARAEEEDGSKAAEILFGLAGVIAATGAVVAPLADADARKYEARTNAQAQTTMAQISANTSKALADQQRDIALTQASISQEISDQNQQATTQRLQMQLAELRNARAEQNQIEQRKQAYQEQLDRERIALAKQQAEETARLASEQMRTQLMLNGQAQGFSRTIDSGAGLVSNPVAAATASTAGQVPTGSMTSTVPLSGAMGVTSKRAVASNRLLESAKGELSEEEKALAEEKERKAVASAKLVRRRTRAAVASVGGIGASLRGVMKSNAVVAGEKSPTKETSEPTKLIANDVPKARTFGEYLNQSATPTLRSAQASDSEVASAGSHSLGFNGPNLGSIDRGLSRGSLRGK